MQLRHVIPRPGDAIPEEKDSDDPKVLTLLNHNAAWCFAKREVAPTILQLLDMSSIVPCKRGTAL